MPCIIARSPDADAAGVDRLLRSAEAEPAGVDRVVM
jgi:hypothetical protein